MRTLKKILVAACIVGLPFLFCSNTQTPTTLDLLSAPNMWRASTTRSSYGYLQFTKQNATGGMVINNVPRGGTSYFYLSDQAEHLTFDQSKVGTVVNGKYIVISQDAEPKVYEIRKINSDSLTLFYDSKGKNIPQVSLYTLYPQYD